MWTPVAALAAVLLVSCSEGEASSRVEAQPPPVPTIEQACDHGLWVAERDLGAWSETQRERYREGCIREVNRRRDELTDDEFAKAGRCVMAAQDIVTLRMCASELPISLN